MHVCRYHSNMAPANTFDAFGAGGQIGYGAGIIRELVCVTVLLYCQERSDCPSISHAHTHTLYTLGVQTLYLMIHLPTFMRNQCLHQCPRVSAITSNWGRFNRRTTALAPWPCLGAVDSTAPPPHRHQARQQPFLFRPAPHRSRQRHQRRSGTRIRVDTDRGQERAAIDMAHRC